MFGIAQYIPLKLSTRHSAKYNDELHSWELFYLLKCLYFCQLSSEIFRLLPGFLHTGSDSWEPLTWLQSTHLLPDKICPFWDGEEREAEKLSCAYPGTLGVVEEGAAGRRLQILVCVLSFTSMSTLAYSKTEHALFLFRTMLSPTTNVTEGESTLSMCSIWTS